MRRIVSKEDYINYVEDEIVFIEAKTRQKQITLKPGAAVSDFVDNLYFSNA